MVLQGAQCLRSDSVQYEQIKVDQLQANASLMAAAPELLEALRHVLVMNEISESEYPEAWAAIAKATGATA